MDRFSKKTTAIEDLTVGHLVSALTIAYQVNAHNVQHAANVELELPGETGRHHTQISLPRDGYYNLPKHIND